MMRRYEECAKILSPEFDGNKPTQDLIERQLILAFNDGLEEAARLVIDTPDAMRTKSLVTRIRLLKLGTP